MDKKLGEAGDGTPAISTVREVNLVCKNPLIIISVACDSIPFEALLDTGASMSLINSTHASDFPSFECDPVNLRFANNSQKSMTRMVRIKLCFEGVTKTLEVGIVECLPY